METYLLMGSFVAIFGALFIGIFVAIATEERTMRAKEQPPTPPAPETSPTRRRRRHLPVA